MWLLSNVHNSCISIKISIVMCIIHAYIKNQLSNLVLLCISHAYIMIYAWNMQNMCEICRKLCATTPLPERHEFAGRGGSGWFVHDPTRPYPLPARVSGRVVKMATRPCPRPSLIGTLRLCCHIWHIWLIWWWRIAKSPSFTIKLLQMLL